MLLLKDNGLVKTVKFKEPQYVGDPINSIRIFNEKEVDELVFLDINATPTKKEPDFDMIYRIAGEAFMPMAYGGGISTIEHIRKVFTLGIEKVIINSAAYDNYSLLKEAVSEYGSQSIVACIDCKKTLFGKYVLYAGGGKIKQKISINNHVKKLIESGIGEIIVNSIDRDGTQNGYDVDLISTISSNVSIPVVACGGASSIDDFASAVTDAGASAVAAGSMFVFKGKHRAVLINYPERHLIESKLI